MDSHKPSDHEKNLDLLFEESRDGFGIRGYTTPDQLKLFLTIDAHPSGTHLHKDLLLEVLAEKGFDLEHLNLGVLDDIVRVINHGEILNEPRRVLIGTPPLNGENGRIVFLVKKFIGAPEVQVDPAGRAHFAELHLFDNVTKGDRIARILPAEPGKDGLDIFGKIISHTPGREYVYQLDPSVRLVKDRADGQQSTFLAADVSGYVREIEGFISIEPCLSIQGNLDFNQGNVDFVGAVEIAGDVMPGFNVKAAYGISVGGSVRGGSLLTTEGEIKVGGYIYGGSSSIVRAGRNLFAGVVQDANTEIIGDIYIRTESLNSTLRTSGRLYMPDANLIGGEVFSVGGVEARDIGNDAGVRTIINLSSDQQASLAYTKLQVQIEVQKAGINKLNLLLGEYADNPERTKELPAEKKERYLQTQNELTRSRTHLGVLFRRLWGMITSHQKKQVLRVSFHGTLHPGTVITADKVEFRPDQALHGPATVVFSIKEKCFKVVDYQPLN